MPSVTLNEAMRGEFQIRSAEARDVAALRVFPRVGCKFDAWHDVAWLPRAADAGGLTTVPGDFEYLTGALRGGDIEALEEAAAIMDDFPEGRDDFTGCRWIINAIDLGSVASIRWMLDQGVDLAFRGDDGSTPLLSALERGGEDRYEVLSLLIAHGAPLDQRGSNDWTPLHSAAAREDLEALRLLVDAGANLQVRTRIDDYATPLEEARTLGRQRAVEFLEALERERG